MTTHATTSSLNSASLPAHQTNAGLVGAAPRQLVVQHGANATPWDWLFPAFFLCMVIAVLPLTGLQWTYPEGSAAWRALQDTLLLSLPIFVPLPFLFAGCLVALAVQPAARTHAAFGFLGVGLLVAAAGLQSVYAVL